MTCPVVTDLADDAIPVKLSCRVLGFSRQAYHAWLASPVSDHERSDTHAANVVLDAHVDDPGSPATGSPSRRAPPQGPAGVRPSSVEGLPTGRCPVPPLDPARGGQRPGPPVHDDLVRSESTAEAPNRLWLTDISEHWAGDSKPHLCAVKDVFSNRIVGYSIDRRMTPTLAVNTLQMAVVRRGGRQNVAGCRVHSDRGPRCRARRLMETIRANGLVGSMGRVGAAGDNATIESFFALTQKNVLNRRRRASFEQLRPAIVTWIPPPAPTNPARTVDTHRIRTAPISTDDHHPTNHVNQTRGRPVVALQFYKQTFE